MSDELTEQELKKIKVVRENVLEIFKDWMMDKEMYLIYAALGSIAGDCLASLLNGKDKETQKELLDAILIKIVPHLGVVDK